MDFTPNAFVNRANVLIGLTSHPGWHELQVILEELCQQTAETLIKFEGWEPQAIMVLQARSKCAYEIRDALYTAIRQRIQMGQEQEMHIATQEQFEKAEPQKVTDSDDIREKALRLFDMMNPAREAKDGEIAFGGTKPPDYRTNK